MTPSKPGGGVGYFGPLLPDHWQSLFILYITLRQITVPLLLGTLEDTFLQILGDWEVLASCHQ